MVIGLGRSPRPVISKTRPTFICPRPGRCFIARRSDSACVVAGRGSRPLSTARRSPTRLLGPSIPYPAPRPSTSKPPAVDSGQVPSPGAGRPSPASPPAKKISPGPLARPREDRRGEDRKKTTKATAEIHQLPGVESSLGTCRPRGPGSPSPGGPRLRQEGWREVSRASEAQRPHDPPSTAGTATLRSLEGGPPPPSRDPRRPASPPAGGATVIDPPAGTCPARSVVPRSSSIAGASHRFGDRSMRWRGKPPSSDRTNLRSGTSYLSQDTASGPGETALHSTRHRVGPVEERGGTPPPCGGRREGRRTVSDGLSPPPAARARR